MRTPAITAISNFLPILLFTLIIRSDVKAADTTFRSLSPFPFGASINTTLLKNNPAYRALVAREYSSLTPENVMKMGSVHPAMNTYSWDNADTLVNFAQQNNQRVHGHTLIWYQSLPAWVTNFAGDSTAWENLFKTHIQTVVSHFAGKLSSWDVVNEAFNDNGTLRSSVWLQHLGPDYIARSFEYAHAADPAVLLFYNDYGHEYSTAKLNAIDSMARSLLQRGIPIHGLGLQMHISKNSSNSSIANAVKVMVQTGLKIHISELDIAMNPENNQSLTYTPAIAQIQADKYNFITRMYKTVPAGQRYGITTWDVSDADTWITGTYNRPDWPLPFDSVYQKKQAYQAIIEGLTSSWNYDASTAQSVAGTYTPLGINGTVITTNFTGGVMTFDNDNSSIQDIGFPFSYNGTIYQQFVLNTNGYIKLGANAPSSASIFYATVSGNTNSVITAPDADMLYPYNHDLTGTGATEYRVYTAGTPGSRVCTIQYKDVADKLAPTQYASMNFQVKLYEGSNLIEFVYGPWTASANAFNLTTGALGIKGLYANASVNLAKGSGTSWSAAVSTASNLFFINGDYSTAGPQFNTRNNALPDAGRTYRFASLNLSLLPVTLLRFSAVDNRSDIVLNWLTGNEVNNSSFEVQRSVDGTLFTTIGTITSKANYNGPVNNYSYTDLTSTGLVGTVYYRLKQNNKDGKSTYSSAIIVYRLKQSANLVITAQNPFYNKLEVRVASAKKGNLILQVLNIKGEVLIIKEATVEAGSTLILLPEGSGLPKGIYFVRGVKEGEVSMVKVMKQ